MCDTPLTCRLKWNSDGLPLVSFDKFTAEAFNAVDSNIMLEDGHKFNTRRAIVIRVPVNDISTDLLRGCLTLAMLLSCNAHAGIVKRLMETRRSKVLYNIKTVIFSRLIKLFKYFLYVLKHIYIFIALLIFEPFTYFTYFDLCDFTVKYGLAIRYTGINNYSSYMPSELLLFSSWNRCHQM